jgi:hypothetical protein
VKKVLLGVLLVVVVVVVALAIDRRGQPESRGEITKVPVPSAWVKTRAEAQAGAVDKLNAAHPKASRANDKQILFGDLHVHTTYSVDAFAWAMPLFHGEGVRPPADACDFARYCADLDFWATTDHAESLTPRHWRDLRTTVQECNKVAGDPKDPDLVTFTGFEWTQMGNTAADHYGHKNVIFPDDGDDQTPTRPIGAGGFGARSMRKSAIPWDQVLLGPYLEWSTRQSQFDQQYKIRDLAAQPMCEDGKKERDLPETCVEFAETPADLYKRLDDWGFDTIVIPHGNTWGYYTPPGSSWDKQLGHGQYDAGRNVLIEVMSGHGNSEEYRDWREVTFDADGEMHCPEPTPDYLPSCWRAGEIIRSRCGDVGAEECERRVQKAQHDYLVAGRAGHLVVGGVEPEDWLDAGQCRDCYVPAFNYRARSSVQYSLAISNFEEKGEDGDPLRFYYGFIASSDNHGAQPGTGYKEIGRHPFTEVGGQEGYVREKYLHAAKVPDPLPESVPYDLANPKFNFIQITESERQQSFFYTGGLAAVHSDGRARDQIWAALKRRETYGTSGERMLLWFDLLDGSGTRPMGSALKIKGKPRFRVRAVGAFEQKPGCPEHSVHALSTERLQHLCAGECNNPSDKRKAIDRIDVIRIRPQATKGENVRDLIEDPWRTFACTGDENGCMVEFDDPSFGSEKREYIYYVRAVEKPTPTVNAGNLRCEKDANGQCVKVSPCFGDSRTELTDDCLAPAGERAWSSPIYLKPG